MASDRDEFRSSGGGETTIVLPDMPPGDPPLQHDAIQYRQTVDTIFAGAGVLGVIGGNWPTEAMTVEENFPIHLLPVPDAATMSASAYAKAVEKIQLYEIKNRRNDALRERYLMLVWTRIFAAVYRSALKNHPAFARDLRETCALPPATGALAGSKWLDGPRAYHLMLFKLMNAGERPRSDKNFYTNILTRCRSRASWGLTA